MVSNPTRHSASGVGTLSPSSPFPALIKKSRESRTRLFRLAALPFRESRETVEQAKRRLRPVYAARVQGGVRFSESRVLGQSEPRAGLSTLCVPEPCSPSEQTDARALDSFQTFFEKLFRQRLRVLEPPGGKVSPGRFARVLDPFPRQETPSQKPRCFSWYGP